MRSMQEEPSCGNLLVETAILDLPRETKKCFSPGNDDHQRYKPRVLITSCRRAVLWSERGNPPLGQEEQERITIRSIL